MFGCPKETLSLAFDILLTLTAMPLRSVDADAAVGEVLGTVLVLVSLIRILDTGIPKLLAATCNKSIMPCYPLMGCIGLHVHDYIIGSSV